MFNVEEAVGRNFSEFSGSSNVQKELKCIPENSGEFSYATDPKNHKGYAGQDTSASYRPSTDKSGILMVQNLYLKYYCRSKPGQKLVLNLSSEMIVLLKVNKHYKVLHLLEIPGIIVKTGKWFQWELITTTHPSAVQHSAEEVWAVRCELPASDEWRRRAACPPQVLACCCTARSRMPANSS